MTMFSYNGIILSVSRSYILMLLILRSSIRMSTYAPYK